MKKVFLGFCVNILFVIVFALSACNVDGDGTYYPKNDELEANLKSHGYIVCFSDTQTGWGGYATKDDDFLYFARPINGQCDFYYNVYQNLENYNVLVKIENDEKFGNIVYCGTENAVNDAGIKVVNVKVEVKL